MARPPSYTEEQEQRFLEIYSADAVRTHLAKELGLKNHQVNSLIKKHFPEDIAARQRTRKASAPRPAAATAKPSSSVAGQAELFTAEILARLKDETEALTAEAPKEESQPLELVRLLKQQAVLEERITALTIERRAADNLLEEITDSIAQLLNPTADKANKAVHKRKHKKPIRLIEVDDDLPDEEEIEEDDDY